MSDVAGSVRYETLQDALELLARSPVPILAGGTDVYPALNDAPAPEHMLDITQIAALRAIRETPEGWSIGATSTWTDIVNATLPPVFDGLKAAAREIGSVQIQNAGTVGGNLCNASPAADGVPPLLTLNACVELASVKGVRRVALNKYITGPRTTTRAPDELLTAIHIPTVSQEARSSFCKLGSRRYLVISIVMGSVTLVADNQGRLMDVRLAAGACSAVAQRLHTLEEALLGQSVHSDLLSMISVAMLPELNPIDDVRGSREYRLLAVQQLLCRLLMSTLHKLPAYALGNSNTEEG